MDIKELRVGNYIEAEGVIAAIIAICGEGDAGYLQVRLPGRKTTEINIANVKPVRLTSGLLTEFCHFDDQLKHIIGIDHHRYYLRFYESYITLLNQKSETVIHFWDVRYLHQLQNLYYALKGKEIAIKFPH